MLKIKDWTDALRSGNYEQGKSMLYDAETDCFCPLGVACDLVYPKFKDRPPEKLNVCNFVVPMRGEIAKLIKDFPLFESYIAFLNDSVGVNFNAIADEIDLLASGDSSHYTTYLNPDGPLNISRIRRLVIME